MTDEHDRVRIDKWLWAARFYKTRALAAAAVEGGKAQVNGERVKPAKPLRWDENHPDWQFVGCARSGGEGPGSADKHYYLNLEAENRLEELRPVGQRRAPRAR